MTRELNFAIEEDGVVYDVTVRQEAGNSINLTMTCSCAGEQDDDFCSHRMAIFEGDASAISEAHAEHLETFQRWVKGSDIETAMAELSRAISQLQIAQEKVDYHRRMLVRRMLD